MSIKIEATIDESDSSFTAFISGLDSANAEVIQLDKTFAVALTGLNRAEADALLPFFKQLLMRN